MEPQSRESTPPHPLSQSASNAEESSHSRQQTPTTAVLNLNGTIQRVRAHNVVRFRLTSGLLNFALHATTLLAALAIGAVLVFTNLGNTAGVPFQLGVGLTTFAIGGFLPNPQHKEDIDAADTLLESNGNAASDRANQVSSAAQYVANIV